MSEWISIKERLPKKFEENLFCDGEEYRVGYLKEIIISAVFPCTFSFESEKHFYYPTHWMPLPKPPNDTLQNFAESDNWKEFFEKEKNDQHH